MNHAPRFAIVAARAFERPVQLRIPFRFGSATVMAAPQAFVQVCIRLANGTEVTGAGAELMIPKWFDKSPNKSNDQNVDELRDTTQDACLAYASTTAPATAWGHSARHYAALQCNGARQGRTALATSFGGALVDRAVMDALCRAMDTSFAVALATNLSGIDAELTPDLAAFAIDDFLRALVMPDTIAVRHTVGMLDPLTCADPAQTSDQLPVALDAVIARYGHRHFKLKLGGDLGADIARLRAIALVLDNLPDYVVTLDGNEQFADAGQVAEFASQLLREPGLRRLAAATVYFEQPLPRDVALRTPAPTVHGIPLLVDESDEDYGAWPAARLHGYSGVSSKSCKGLYKSVINAMRCAQWNRDIGYTRYFLSGEDLTAQAGLAVQQDTALAAMLGITHIERNGHHYVDGFAGQGAPAAEWDAFVTAHSDLYAMAGDNVRLVIRAGILTIGSLCRVGYATSARPDFSMLVPMRAQTGGPMMHVSRQA